MPESFGRDEAATARRGRGSIGCQTFTRTSGPFFDSNDVQRDIESRPPAVAQNA